MRLRRTALMCALFAAGAQLASGCCHYRPLLCRPIFPRLCWPHCYQPGVGDPGCASCFSAGAPVAHGPVFTGNPMPLPGPSIQQIPMGTPMPTTGGAPKTGN